MTRRLDRLGVHSLDQFCLRVPDLGAAQRFYGGFGLEAREAGDRLELYAADSDHCWGVLSEGKKKGLERMVFGAYADDMQKLEQRVKALNIELLKPRAETSAFAFRDPSGNVIEVRAAEKSSPDMRTSVVQPARASDYRGAPMRGETGLVRPRRLSHALVFVHDVHEAIKFYQDALGVRLSDESGGLVAFMHGAHGSDHHMIAFTKSDGGGFHHCSWDVGSVEDIGRGAEQMADLGFDSGWGFGRHVLGSNYFHYVRDPWGSFSEYSFDIDYIPAEQEWVSTSPPPENGFYLWGPKPPEDFGRNHELA